MKIMRLSLLPIGMSICPLIARFTRKQLVTSLIDCGSASDIGRFGFSFVESTETLPVDLITISLSSDIPAASTDRLNEICVVSQWLIAACPALHSPKSGVVEVSSSVDLKRILLSTSVVM